MLERHSVDMCVCKHVKVWLHVVCRQLRFQMTTGAYHHVCIGADHVWPREFHDTSASSVFVSERCFPFHNTMALVPSMGLCLLKVFCVSRFASTVPQSNRRQLCLARGEPRPAEAQPHHPEQQGFGWVAFLSSAVRVGGTREHTFEMPVSSSPFCIPFIVEPQNWSCCSSCL